MNFLSNLFSMNFCWTTHCSWTCWRLRWEKLLFLDELDVDDNVNLDVGDVAEKSALPDELLDDSFFERVVEKLLSVSSMSSNSLLTHCSDEHRKHSHAGLIELLLLSWLSLLLLRLLLHLVVSSPSMERLEWTSMIVVHVAFQCWPWLLLLVSILMITM